MIKRLVFCVVLAVCVFASVSAHAQGSYPLGKTNFAVKVDYFSFQDDLFDDVDLEGGLYLGFEGYGSLFCPNLYFGAEIGWATTENEGWSGIVDPVRYDVDVLYIPLEVNSKYAFELGPGLSLDVGAGISLNYFDIDLESWHISEDESDWVFGGQIFADFNYKISNWFLGANAKYQLTDDLEFDVAGTRVDTDVSASNFRLGAHAGMTF